MSYTKKNLTNLQDLFIYASKFFKKFLFTNSQPLENLWQWCIAIKIEG